MWPGRSARRYLVWALAVVAALAWTGLLMGIGIDDLSDGDHKPGVVLSIVLLALAIAALLEAARRLLQSMRPFLGRLLATVRIVLTSSRIPRPLRFGATIALLPVPGPLDEAVLLVVAVVLWAFYRQELRHAWEQTAPDHQRRATVSV